MASASDAANIEISIVLDRDEYVINGRKWWSSDAMDPHCKLAVVMGRTDPNAPRHQQQSMILAAYDNLLQYHDVRLNKHASLPCPQPIKWIKKGNKEAKNLIAMIKIIAPNMAIKVIDRAIQILGGKGVSQDTFLAYYFAIARILWLADGPDEVHMYQLDKSCVKKYGKE